MLHTLPQRFCWDAFNRLARKQLRKDRARAIRLQSKMRALGIKEMVINGRYGPLRMSTADIIIAHVYLDTGAWDASAINYLRDALADGGTFIDVGANVGIYVRAIGANERVNGLAFEPDPGNFRLLRANAKHNNTSSRIKCRHAAILDVPGEVELELSPDNMGDHRVRGSSRGVGVWGEDQRPTIRVPAVRADAELAAIEVRSPLVVKIDVQGAEPSVLRAFGSMLGRIDLMLTEFWPYGIRRFGEDPAKALDMLSEVFSRAEYTPLGGDLRTTLRPIKAVRDEIWSWINSNDPDVSADLLLART